MKRFFRKYSPAILLSLFLTAGLSLVSCSEDENTLAPYAGSAGLSGILIEQESFHPRITWLGGYASVMGVNRDSSGGLNPSLVWLIHTNGNNLRYPVTFGQLPEGAEDITARYGGTKADSLEEDVKYTFWIMKEEIWNQVSGGSFKYIQQDSSLSSEYVISGDTLIINSKEHSQKTQNLDVFVNIENVTPSGTRVGVISVTATNSNRPIVSWSTDTLLAAIGLVEGQQFKEVYKLWDMYSETNDGGTALYGRENVIPKPINIGDDVQGTFTFIELREGAIERGKTYYIWIATKTWDRVNRGRFTWGYSFATFNVR